MPDTTPITDVEIPPSHAAAKNAIDYLIRYEDGPRQLLSVEGARMLDILRRYIEAQDA